MLAVLMLIMYVMVILPVVLWMGAKAINNLTSLDLILSMILLGGLSLAYSLYGGLKSCSYDRYYPEPCFIGFFRAICLLSWLQRDFLMGMELSKDSYDASKRIFRRFDAILSYTLKGRRSRSLRKLS